MNSFFVYKAFILTVYNNTGSAQRGAFVQIFLQWKSNDYYTT